MTISLITGMTKNRVIGKNNTLPWHIKDDLKLFKELTLNNTVIMGYKTYISLPENFRPLPNRNNIVLSDRPTEIENVYVALSIKEALEKAKEYNKKIFFIGGAMTYKDALPLVDELCISWIKKDYEGDTYFPDFNEDKFEVIEEKEFEEFVFKRYRRK